MPGPSLEDMSHEQLAEHARQLQGSANLLQQLLGDPSTREVIQRKLKKDNPALAIPEIDAQDKVMAALEEEKKERQNLQKQMLERDVRERLEKARAAAKATYQLSEADMAEVEKLMTDAENPIPTYDAAARVFKASKATGTPTTADIRPPVFDMPEKDVWGKGIGNKAMLDKIAINEAYSALNDLRAGKVAGMGPAVAN